MTVVGTGPRSVLGMFADAGVVGCSWPVLAARLDGAGAVAGWAAAEPGLAGMGTAADLVAGWADPARTHAVGDGLARLAAADGGGDGDALLVVLHLASPVVWRLAGRLADLTPDIVAVVVGELCCQVRGYRWRTRRGGLLVNLERDTAQAVLAEFRPGWRRGSPERLTLDGRLPEPRAEGAACPGGDVDPDVLLGWAVSRGAVSDGQVRLLLDCQAGRIAEVAAARGLSERALYRRRRRALAGLRAAAGELLAATG